MRFSITLLLLGSVFFSTVAARQEPPPPPPPATPSDATPQDAPPKPESSSSGKQHKRSLPPFLIVGTVFNEQALAFPGVQVKIRRKGDKKFPLTTYTNSRGEFAIRVPVGIEYEVLVRQKGYKDQSEFLTANAEDVQKRLTFRLESITPPKAGEPK